MKSLVEWLRLKIKQRTPTTVSVLIIFLLLTDLTLAMALGKKLLFPFSKTTGAYVLWLGTIISFVTGYVFWPLSIAITVLRAYLTRRKIGKLESASIVGPIFNKTAEVLDKLSAALSTLGVAVLALIALVWGLAWASHPPAPPNPGQLVISNWPGSEALYRVVGNAVAIYYKNEIGGTLSPVQYLQLSGSSTIDDIAVSHDESRIYATDSANGLLHVIDGRRRLREIDTKYVGKTATSVVLSADGRKLYVGVVGPIPLGKIRVFDAVTLTELGAIDNVGCPVDLFVPRARPLLFVATQCGLNNDPLYVIDTRKDKVIREIPGFATGSRVIATHDGRIVVISTGDRFYILRHYMNDSPDIRKVQIPISAMAFIRDEKTLLVGTSVEYKGQTVGEIISLDAETGTRCGNAPMILEAPPQVIAIATDGGLLSPMPTRIVVGDSRALECSGSGKE